MSHHGGHAHAVGVNLPIRRSQLRTVDLAEDLGDLLSDLALLAVDPGDDVGGNIECGYAGIARTGDGLIAGDDEASDAEPPQRLQRQRQAGAGAVGVGDNFTPAPLLPGQGWVPEIEAGG